MWLLPRGSNRYRTARGRERVTRFRKCRQRFRAGQSPGKTGLMIQVHLDRTDDVTRSLPRAVRYRKRILALLFIVARAFAVRSLTANFLRAHFDDPGWFQSGSYAVFDAQAQDILDHKTPAFWIDDPSRTDRIVYPPGYPLWMAFIYAVTGDRSPVSLQRVQLVIDSLAVLLI